MEQSIRVHVIPSDNLSGFPMKDLLSVCSKIAAVVVATVIFMQVTTVVLAEPKPHRFLNLHSVTIWTSTPFRVAREQQRYERIPAPPDPFPFKFRADRDFSALNSHQFKYKGEIYTLIGAPVVARNAVCKKEDGKRYACGLSAFRALSNAMRGRFVECRLSNSRTSKQTAICVNNGRPIVDLLSTGS